ncbi:MAG: toprim domain-containing protein, partial [Cyanobacteria bacterium J06631_9]
PFRGMAPGTVRDQGWFWLGAGRGAVSRVILTESPIDTMSLARIDSQQRSREKSATIYLSVDGAGAMPVGALKAAMQQGGKVMLAFDADRAGELMAWRVAHQLHGVSRLYPSRGKDWNEQLVGKKHPCSVDSKSVELWKWYAAARSLNRPEKYLKRIAEVALAYVKGSPLSEKAKIAMKRDLQGMVKKAASSCEYG